MVDDVLRGIVLKVAFVTPWDPADRGAWSGVLNPAYRCLQDRVELVPVVPDISDAILDRALTRFNAQIFGKNIFPL